MRSFRSAAGLASVALVGVAPLASQEPTIGVRSALVYPQLSGFRGAPGYTIGPTVAVWLNPWLAVQGEVLYTTFGGRFSDGARTAGVWSGGEGFGLSSPFASFQYLQAPIVARLDLGRLLSGPVRPTLYVGPQVSYLLGCRAGRDATTADPLRCGSLVPVGGGQAEFVGMRNWDAGAVGGAGLVADLFGFVQVAGEVRYQHGFLAIDPLATGLRNNAWSLVFRLSGTGVARGSQGYFDAPDGFVDGPVVPRPARRGQQAPSIKGPIKGIIM